MNTIPGWFDWHTIYSDAVRRAPSEGARFVETGTFFGKSADFLAREILCSGKEIVFETWDLWCGVSPTPGYAGWLGEPLNEERVRHTLAGLPVTVRTGDALAAAACYADGSLDMVFLDDDHDEEHVYRECCAWWPKVKVGGIMAGHDYDRRSVVKGVERWALEAGLSVRPVSVRCWMATR